MAIGGSLTDMSDNDLKSIANGNPETGYYNTDKWRSAATAELNRRGVDKNAPAIAPDPIPDPISADAHFIVTNASRDAARIIKHLWIIFVILPFVLGIVGLLVVAASK
jgi:hypothetical protein